MIICLSCVCLVTTGLDDARNTAALCARLVQDGCQLKITKSLHRPKVHNYNYSY